MFVDCDSWALVFKRLTIPSQKYNVTRAMLLSPREQLQVDLYRQLRERFHEGPYYSVLDSASSSAKKGSAARANYDPFHGMPSYAGRYQKKKRTLPKLQGRQYSESHMLYHWPMMVDIERDTCQ